MPPKKTKKKKERGSLPDSEANEGKGRIKRGKSSVGESSDLRDLDEEEQFVEEEVVKRKSRGKFSLGRTSGDQFSEGRVSRGRISTAATVEMAEAEEDIVTLIVPETAQKIVHCLVGKDLFVDKTWCMIKKADILEDVTIEDANSPFYNLTQRIKQYKPSELLIGYEPFSGVGNQFMLCLTEAGRDQVLNKLETMKSTYLRRIEQSKEVEPRPWQSQGSEEFVNQFQVKHTRKLISLEWIGDITKRCYTEPNFEDCEPDQMKNGYTCLVPSDKEKFDLVYKKTQDTGIQAVAQKGEAGVQTDPEIPTNACTQYAPETEISLKETSVTQEAIKTQDLNAFFDKYLDYLLKCLDYNEVYDLYHDDYPALYVGGEETQVQQLGTYHQYQSFTDVAAIEGKLVVSTSWHPNYTGIVAIAYANEIPCLMKELEFDSDQTDYEEEKTDEEGEGGEEPELGRGARDWLVDEKKERESTSQSTELYDRAVRRLKDIETAKLVWDLKIQEDTEEHRRATSDTMESDMMHDKYQYKEYKEPEPELEDIGEEGEEGVTPEVAEGQEPEAEEEAFGTLGKEESGSQKTNTKSSKRSLRDTLEADIAEAADEVESPATQVIEEGDEYIEDEDGSDMKEVSASTTRSKQDTASFRMTSREARTISGAQRTSSRDSSRKKSHHRKKYKRSIVPEAKQSVIDQESVKSQRTPSRSESSLGLSETTRRDIKMPYYHDHEFFDEITDEEEIKEKQDELPLLELNNPVLIWSFVDDLTPKLRLDSPYEVRVVSFSQHNGNLIAGGTASGQVVVWDITGRIEELERAEALTQNQQKFRKRMEDMMNWRRDIRSKRRVRISAISNQAESHLEKITHLMWVGPTITVTDTMDIIQNPLPEPNLQLITSSVYGDLKVWDLKSDPMKVDTKKLVQQFKTKERFGRPASLDVGVSPHNRLHRRWKPRVGLMTKYKNSPVLLTGFHFHNIPIKYVRLYGRMFTGIKEVLEDRIEYRAVPAKVDSIPLQMYTANLFGEAGTIVWEPPEAKPVDGGGKMIPDIPHTCRSWDSYHDGPIYRVAKHPFIPSVCLTVGGHVFALWHVANEEEPILAKRYFGVYVTDGSWSPLRPSLIRIARSDGVVEIWDLVIQNHAPATTVIVSGRVITNVSSPLLTEVRGLLGVADYNSAFRLFFIPQQFRVWTESELVRLTKFINREPERKKKMKAWSKWWRENNVNSDREEKKQAEEKKKQDEEVRLEKEKQEEARKKYNEEVYKWYMRRRGKPFLWQEEADDKWREKQEQHMHEVVMEKKKIDRSEMEILMRPIVREEKNEAYKHEKAQERLKQADTIFRQTVELIFPKSSKKVLATSEETVSLSDECNKLVDYYFGDNFEKLADEQEGLIKRSPWQFDFEWSELLEKYNALRMLFNDRRRKRSKTLRWLRKKLREELLKEKRKVHIRRSHMARYPKRKIKRRQENFEWLKQTYGDDYNIYWDKHHPCRRFTDRKFRYQTADDADSHFLVEFTEPEVEDEDVPQIFTEEKARSSLELITQMGIEFIPEEIFKADLDATLITLEGRSSLGVKSIPSFVDKSSRKPSAASEELRVSDLHLVPPGCQSPQDDSDVSTAEEDAEDTTSIVDNQLQELDYVQQSVGAKIDTLQTKKAATQQKREISEGVKVKTDEGSTDEELDVADGDSETLDGSSASKQGSKPGSGSRVGSKVSEKSKTEVEEDVDENQELEEQEVDDQDVKDPEEDSTVTNV